MSTTNKSDVNKVFNLFLKDYSNKQDVLSVAEPIFRKQKCLEFVPLLSKKLDEHLLYKNCEKDIRGFQITLIELL